MATKSHLAMRADVRRWIEAGQVGIWRRLSGRTQPEAAAEVGVSTRTLSRWETNQSRPVNQAHVRAYHECLTVWRKQARRSHPGVEL